MAEYLKTVGRLGQVIREAFDHFDLAMREGDSVSDLACAIVGLIESVWLNQCLSKRHPVDKSEPVGTLLRRGRRRRGAVAPKKGAK